MPGMASVTDIAKLQPLRDNDSIKKVHLYQMHLWLYEMQPNVSFRPDNVVDIVWPQFAIIECIRVRSDDRVTQVNPPGSHARTHQIDGCGGTDVDQCLREVVQ